MRPFTAIASTAILPAFLAAGASAQTPRGIPSRAAVTHVADSIAESVTRNGGVAGLAIAVLRGNDTLVMKGYGSADLENDLPATAQTVYRIGSVTKQFTSVAIMQLVQQGKLSLDDDVTKYVPNAPTHGRRILVRHLLNHTSGIPSYTDVGPEFGRVARLDLSHDSLLAVVRDDSLQFEPGSHFYYNNTGYYLLGMVIEKVTGKPYGDYVRDALFVPNGLTSTVYCSVGPTHQAASTRLRSRTQWTRQRGLYRHGPAVRGRFALLDRRRPRGVDASPPQREARERVLVRDHDHTRQADERTTHVLRLRTLGRHAGHAPPNPSRRRHQRLHLGAGVLP